MIYTAWDADVGESESATIVDARTPMLAARRYSETTWAARGRPESATIVVCEPGPIEDKTGEVRGKRTAFVVTPVHATIFDCQEIDLGPV